MSNRHFRMKKFLILLPLFTLSCANNWFKKADSSANTADKEEASAEILQALPVDDEAIVDVPNLPQAVDNQITFVTPDTTSKLVGEEEKRSVSPKLKAPERPPLDSNSVNTSPPAPKASPPKD